MHHQRNALDLLPIHILPLALYTVSNVCGGGQPSAIAVLRGLVALLSRGRRPIEEPPTVIASAPIDWQYSCMRMTFAKINNLWQHPARSRGRPVCRVANYAKPYQLLLIDSRRIALLFESEPAGCSGAGSDSLACLLTASCLLLLLHVPPKIEIGDFARW